MAMKNQLMVNSIKRGEDENLLKQMAGFSEELLITGVEQVGYQKILENLLVISKAKYGVLTLLNESTGKYTTAAVAGIADKLNKAVKILGFEIIGKEWDEYSIDNSHLEGQIVSHFSSLGELSGRVLPLIITRAVEQLLDIGEITVTKVNVNHQMIGDFSLIMPAGKHLENEYLVEIYARQIDLFITRNGAEAEIIKAKEYFELMFNTGPDSNLLTRLSDGLIVNANNGFLVMTGFPLNEVIGKSTLELNLYENPDDRQRIINSLKEKGYCDNEEAVYRRKVGSKFTVSISAKTTMLNGVTHIFSSTRDITDLKKVEKDLLDSEQKYRRLFETMAQGVIYYDVTGNIIFANPSAERILGLSTEQLQGETFQNINWKIVREDGSDLPLEEHPIFVTFRTGKQIDNYTLGMFNPNTNKNIWLTTTTIPIFQPGQEKPFQVYSTFENITERKQAEEALRKSEERYTLMNNSSRDSICSFDGCGGRFTSANKNLCNTLQLEAHQIIGKTYRELGFPEEVSQEWDKLHKKVYEIDNTCISETTAPVPDGSIHNYEVILDPLHDNQGNIVGIAQTTRDITERKQAEEALRESEEKYRHLHESAAVGVGYYSPDGKVISYNTMAAKHMGGKPEDFNGKSIYELFPKMAADVYMDRINKAAESDEIQDYEDKVELPQKQMWFSSVFTRILNSSNHIIGVQIISTDISARKEAEEVLRVHQFELETQNEELSRMQGELETSRARYFDLYDLAPVGYFTIEENGLILEANLTAAVMLSIARGSLVNRLLSRFILKEDQNIYFLLHKQLFETGKPQDFQLRMVKKDGTIFWAHLVATATQSGNGAPIYRVTLNDITERKRAEEFLRESENRYNFALEGTGAGLWDWDMVNDEVVYSERWKNMLGYEVQEVENSFSGWKNLWHPDDSARIEKAIEDYLTGKSEKYEIIHRCRHKDGDWRWILTRGATIKDTEGKPYRWVGTNLDITENKQLEENLNLNRAKLELALQASQMGAWQFNIVENKRIFDNQVCLLLGINPATFGGSAEEFFAAVHPDDREKTKAAMKKTIEQNVLYEPEYRSVWPDGSTHYICARGKLFLDDKGNPQVINGIIWDNTEHKLAEEALKASEEKYRLITENASDVIWVFNLSQNKFTYMSPALFQLTGFTAEEAMKGDLEDTITKESLLIVKDALARNVAEFIKNPNAPNYQINEIQSPCKNGDIIWTESSSRIRYSITGDIEIVGVTRNIEERKKAEQEVLYISNHDPLTGLYNRRHFDNEIKRLNVEKSSPLTLVMADVNGLKLTNDAFGHQAGDRVLEKVAAILQRECRSEDIVARIGGDEFVLLLPDTDSENADKLINRINAAIADEKIDNVVLSLSIGSAVRKDKAGDINKVFKQAEDEMYRHKLSESKSMRSKTLDIIMNTLYEKSHREMAHSMRVSQLCEAIGTKMNFSQDDINQVRIAGLIHDIGKIGIDEKILNKPEKLTSNEWKEIKRHPEIGYRILSSVSEFSVIADDVLQHQEKWNGGGYPRGLKGDEISLQARIIAVADAYDAMTGERTYKKPLSEAEAIKEIKRCSGTQFAPDIAKIFIEKVLEKEWV